MRAPTQISSDLVVCVEGGPVLLHRVGGGDSGQGCLCTAVLFGIDHSMPGVWCSICVGGDAVLFDGSSIGDVANVVRGCDGLARKPIGDCMLWMVTVMLYDVWAPSSHPVSLYHD